MCVLFETRSNSSPCPWQLKKLRMELFTYLIWIFGFAAQTVLLLTTIPIYTPMILHDRHLSVRGWHMSSEREGPGAYSSDFLGWTVFHSLYKYPCLFLTSLSPRSRSLPLELPKTLVPPLLHRRQWGRASLPRPRRHRTRASCGFLHSPAAVAIFLCRVRAWKIWPNELHICSSQFVVFFTSGN